MPELHHLPVTGVVPPQDAVATIREAWPSVTRFPAVAQLGRRLTSTIFLAPLAWLLMAPFYFAKVLPPFACRYRITNRGVEIRKAWGKLAQEIALADIDDVRLQTDGNSEFFRAGTLELVCSGEVRMRLPGTPEPESFRIAIVNACNAWVPGRTSKHGPFIPASAP